MNHGLPPVGSASQIVGAQKPENQPLGAPVVYKIPLLVTLSYWQGDRSQCRKLCSLMADLQPAHVGDACTIMLVCRQDCDIDKEMVHKLSTRFNVLTYKANSPLRGWPGGCNGMFGSTMIHISNTGIQAECVFWMEADCVPTRPDWFIELSQVWRTRRPAANVVGCMFDCNGNGSGNHITGCALYNTNFARILPNACSCDQIAWDYQYRREIVMMGQHTDKISLRFRGYNVEPTFLDGEKAAVVHGYKDDSLLDLVRSKFVLTNADAQVA